MKRCFKLACVALFIVQTCHLQAQDIKIKLSAKKAVFENQDFSIDKVLDCRENKMMIGLVQRGLKNRKRVAKMHKGIVFQFEKFISKSLRSIENPTYRILLIVRKLEIAESSLRYNEKASLKVIYDFYAVHEKQYKRIYRSNEYYTNTSMLDVTSSHDNLIEKSILDALNNIIKTDWRKKLPVIDVESYQEMTAIRSFKYPILSAVDLKKGIYLTLDDFRKNDPKDLDFKYTENHEEHTAKIEKSGGMIVVHDASGNPEKVTWRIWGFSTGQQVYIRNSHGNFVRLERKNNSFYFKDFIRMVESTKNRAGFGGLIGERKEYSMFRLDLTSGEFIYTGG